LKWWRTAPADGKALHGEREWNSWDVFVQPIGLAANLWSMLTTPESYRTASRFTAVFGGFFLFAYVVLFGLMTHRPKPSPSAVIQ
jgi:uncharacterized membrane protein